MGADYFESESQISSQAIATKVPMGVGANAVIHGSIVDKNCRIGDGVVISNDKQIAETSLTHPQFVIRDGIPVIIKGAILPHGWKLSDAF
jgi:glucose-1-phosphate adenylyltransferase